MSVLHPALLYSSCSLHSVTVLCYIHYIIISVYVCLSVSVSVCVAQPFIDCLLLNVVINILH